MADLIDRQAAIKAIENLQDCYNGFSDTYDKACIIGVLMEIPTAQVNTQTDTPTDMISRQAALALAKDICVPIKDGTVYRHRCIDPQQIMDLPSAQRTGRWIIKDNPKIRWYRVTCSECGEDVTSVIPLIGFFPNVKALWDFCPNCGCAMEGEEE